MRKITLILMSFTILTASACSKQPDLLLDREAAYYKSPVQDEIELMRKDMADNSKWGRGEVKPWNERYKTDNSELPYLGPMGSHGLYRY